MSRLVLALVLLCGLAVGGAAARTADERGDYAAAYRQFKALAARGDAGAQAVLGVMYANGQGVAVDYFKAVKWYRRAAEQGNAAAQYNLGVMYAKGQGVERDKVRAHMWLALGAAMGDSDANKGRDMIARSLAPAALATARAMARDWREEHADPTPKPPGDAQGILVSITANRHLYAGNTALGVSASGREFRVYFGRNGSVEYRGADGVTQHGTWTITAGGMLCYAWATWPHRCYIHYKTGDEYQSYRDGKKKGSRFVIKRGKIGFGE